MLLRFLREQRIIFWLLIISYFFTRLYNLTLLPIFTDEAIYIYWAKFIVTTHSHWFIALTDGKPPPLTWIIGVLLTIFPQDWYLFAGRLPSVFFGLITLVGAYKLPQLLFQSQKVALLSMLFLVLSPFMLTYERLALYDAQLTAMLIWSVYFCVKTAKTLSFKYALLWGVFLGFGFLSKPPALLYLLITPVCFFLLMGMKTIRTNWKQILLCVLLVAVVSEGLNNMQRISGAYQASLIKNQQFQQPLSELLRDPFLLIPGNMYVFSTWLFAYYTPLVLFGVIVGFLITIKIKRREGIVFFLLWVGPIIAFAIAGRQIFPRYLLFMTPYAFIALSYSISLLWGKKKEKIATLLIISLLILPLRFFYLLLTNPTISPLPTADFNQLVAEHPSGYGLDQVYSFIRSESAKGKVTVVPQGTFGLYPYAFYLEFWGDPKVRILPKWPLDRFDEEMYEARKDGAVIVVLKEDKVLPPELQNLILVKKIKKPYSTKYPILLTVMR